jgi:predicted lipoprotein with Yx(FWY)xxD motif
MAALALLAGCGSSSNSTSSSSNAAASGGGSSAYGGGSAYGGKPAAATTTSAPAGGATQVATASGKLGTFLVAGPKKMTVYLFEADKGGTSSCSGACASAWPPVTTSGTPSVGGSVSSAQLSTIVRPDGSKQVTYNRHPLYYFVQDKAAGETTGQGAKAFGASWYVLAPSGMKIDKS